MRQLSGVFGVFANLRIFDGILRRLTGFFQLTQEELSDAGIYIGNRR
jgi:hypothetical protein